MRKFVAKKHGNNHVVIRIGKEEVIRRMIDDILADMVIQMMGSSIIRMSEKDVFDFEGKGQEITIETYCMHPLEFKTALELIESISLVIPKQHRILVHQLKDLLTKQPLDHKYFK